MIIFEYIFDMIAYIIRGIENLQRQFTDEYVTETWMKQFKNNDGRL